MGQLSLVKTRVVSFLWSFAEATFFFFVPDVWLTRIAVHNPHEAYINIVIATAGAVFGGLVMYFFGVYAFAEAQVFLDTIPAINAKMLEDVGVQMQGGAVYSAMQVGSLSGVPFKIYAVWAGHLGLGGVGATQFVFMSAGVRSLRFALITVLAHGIVRVLKSRLSDRALLRVHAGLWVLFYAYYFYLMA